MLQCVGKALTFQTLLLSFPSAPPLSQDIQADAEFQCLKAVMFEAMTRHPAQHSSSYDKLILKLLMTSVYMPTVWLDIWPSEM
jgi:hypothetical protein